MPEKRAEQALVEGAEGGSAAPVAAEAAWYKDAVIYELHVKAFCDSNGDGIGDFPGLIGKLDYLRDLGVTAVWLLPFYPSPLRDDGYDIADYRNVHPHYGTRADFRQFVREAHRRDLKVISELVINHTSDQHPWFQAARCAPAGSSKRNFYVWSDSDTRYAGTRIIFADTEISNWTWDEVAQAYYWHRFFAHQPDLNFANHKVRKALIRVMRSWLDAGVDGLRLDAIPYLCEREGTSNENLPETHEVIKEIRAVIDAHYGNRMLLAEANQWPEDVRDYFGDGDECHMAYHFPLMPRMYMAIAEEDRHPIVEIMQQTPEIPDRCQWAIFLRNHDELTLEMVTSRERDYMYRMYAADQRARINLGIRRRLAPLMENDPDKIKLMNAMLMSMPGSPIIYYGDELGMGDNIYLGDRNGVRTPMQWSPDRNAGFSSADPQRLYLPPIMDAVYGYAAVNVEAQARDASSLLNWMRRVLAVRRNHPAFGRGTLTFLRPTNRKILAFVRELGDETILCVTNLARTAQAVELDLARFKGRVPVELMGRTAFPMVGELPYLLTLHGHGFYWLHLTAGADLPTGQDLPPLAHEDAPTLVFFDGWHSIFRERVVPWRIAMAEKLRAQMENEALPRFVAAQAWHPSTGEAPRPLRLADHAEWSESGGNWLLALWQPEHRPDEAPNIFLPLSLIWENGSDEALRALQPATVARVRQQSRLGILGDAFADVAFCRALVTAIGTGRELRCARGSIRCVPTHAGAMVAGESLAVLPVRVPGAQAKATAVTFGQRLYLKVYRCFHDRVNDDLEVGRFLTEVAQFPYIAKVLGVVEYRCDDGKVMPLALLQSFVENQGDGWGYTLDYLQRYLDHLRTTDTAAADTETSHGAYLTLIGILGQRTAELHRALALRTGDPAFDPEPVGRTEFSAWLDELHERIATTLDLLALRRAVLPDAAQADARHLLERRQVLLNAADSRAAMFPLGIKIRCHGDFHLGQVLLTQNDFAIINFAGEPAPGTKSRKQSPLRDVARMLGSFTAVARTAIAQHVETVVAGNEAASLRAWQSASIAAFLAGYRETTTDLYGNDWAAARRLLGLFMIEQIVGEVSYGLTQVEEAPASLCAALASHAGMTGVVDGTTMSIAVSNPQEASDGNAG
jgi:maltose alpha-D-glucosyltransferase / alpha-amylase